MEITKIDKNAGLELIKMLGLEQKCKYCGSEITEENFGGVFSKPPRACCNNIGCISEAIYDTNEKVAEDHSGDLNGK